MHISNLEETVNEKKRKIAFFNMLNVSEPVMHATLSMGCTM